MFVAGLAGCRGSPLDLGLVLVGCRRGRSVGLLGFDFGWLVRRRGRLVVLVGFVHLQIGSSLVLAGSVWKCCRRDLCLVVVGVALYYLRRDLYLPAAGIDLYYLRID